MNRLWLLVLVLSLLGCELLACWLDQNGRPFRSFEVTYRVFHLLQMVVLILLAFLSYSSIERASFWRTVSRFILAGLGFSLVGDVINSFLIDLSFILKPQTLLSAIPFAIAHFLYISCFIKLGRMGASGIGGRTVAVTIVLWLVLSSGLWQMLVDSSAGPVLKWLSFGYAHIVVLMALTSLWPIKALGKVAWVAAAGGFVFLISDGFFGAWLVEGQNRPLWVSQLIWTTYFLAQLCIMHVPLIGQKRVAG